MITTGGLLYIMIAIMVGAFAISLVQKCNKQKSGEESGKKDKDIVIESLDKDDIENKGAKNIEDIDNIVR